MRAITGTALAAAALAALVFPAGALAGGWATVGLSSTPHGHAPGEPWVVEIEVLQHGVTPLEGAEPAVTITEREGGASRTVGAEPTARPGVYRAEVSFPRAGEWGYEIEDGFTRTHTYPPVRIGAPRAASDAGSGGGGGPPWSRLGIALAAGLLAAAGTIASRRRRARGAVPAEA